MIKRILTLQNFDQGGYTGNSLKLAVYEGGLL